METILVPPYAPSLIEASRAIGYSIETAISDIVDNSITAEARKIEIVSSPFSDPYIAIIDDGIGMNLEELMQAMRFGSKHPLDIRSSNDLGRFGLGLKTASFSQCRKLTVLSKIDGKIYGVQWDLDVIEKTQEWSLGVLNELEISQKPLFEKLSNSNSGTIVCWEHLDRLMTSGIDMISKMGSIVVSLEDHLALVFHRFLMGEQGVKKIEIKMNDHNVIPIDPFLSSKSHQYMDDEVYLVESEKITVRPFILPHPSKLSQQEIKSIGGNDGLKKNQGFYIYRNKRLIMWGTWFRLMKKDDQSKLARVMVDIPNTLDSLWTLDIKKSIAIPPDIVKQKLVTIIEKLSEGSKRTWTYRGKKEVGDDKIRLWNRTITREKGIIYSINREHPIVKKILEDSLNYKFIDYMLNQIEHLPLNQLYVDLTSEDDKVVNQPSATEIEIEGILKKLKHECRSLEEWKLKKDVIRKTDTFDQYLEILDRI